MYEYVVLCKQGSWDLSASRISVFPIFWNNFAIIVKEKEVCKEILLFVINFKKFVETGD